MPMRESGHRRRSLLIVTSIIARSPMLLNQYSLFSMRMRGAACVCALGGSGARSNHSSRARRRARENLPGGAKNEGCMTIRVWATGALWATLRAVVPTAGDLVWTTCHETHRDRAPSEG